MDVCLLVRFLYNWTSSLEFKSFCIENPCCQVLPVHHGSTCPSCLLLVIQWLASLPQTPWPRIGKIKKSLKKRCEWISGCLLLFHVFTFNRGQEIVTPGLAGDKRFNVATPFWYINCLFLCNIFIYSATVFFFNSLLYNSKSHPYENGVLCVLNMFYWHFSHKN